MSRDERPPATARPDPSPPPVDSEALRSLPAPVTVLGVAADGVLGGLTASWVTRVSEEPPLLLVAVGRTRRTWELLGAAECFSVSVLAAGQVDEARLFGLHSRREVDKWAAVEHVLPDGLTPALKHCRARFLCRIRDAIATGDHDCYVGEILAAESVSSGPALPLRGEDYRP